jgi:hypothetical protein
MIRLEPVSPKMRASFSVNKLHIDPYLVPGPSNAAFQHIPHAKLTADLPNVDGFTLVGEGGIAGDHEAFGDAGEIRGQIVGDAIGEILLLRIIRQIRERQNNDRQLGCLRRSHWIAGTSRRRDRRQSCHRSGT